MEDYSDLAIGLIIATVVILIFGMFFRFVTTDVKEDNKTRRAEVEACETVEDQSLQAWCIAES